MEGVSGLLVLIEVIALPLLIAAALVFAFIWWKQRPRKTPATRHAQERATEDLYRKPE